MYVPPQPRHSRRLHSARAWSQYTLLDFKRPRSWFGERRKTKMRGTKVRTGFGSESAYVIGHAGDFLSLHFSTATRKSVGLARGRVQWTTVWFREKLLHDGGNGSRCLLYIALQTAPVFARACQDAGGRRDGPLSGTEARGTRTRRGGGEKAGSTVGLLTKVLQGKVKYLGRNSWLLLLHCRLTNGIRLRHAHLAIVGTNGK